ncbi:MAG: shikimate dehydrogenase [Candidatus Riflebacteria bacterium]|nr:shikimate dehydrogenase [Candidatus Riflebacteria bacterium]
MNSINAATSVYALIGYPVEHSLSPSFWNAAFEKLEMNAVYVALPVIQKEVFSALNGLKASGIKGLNITRPHKESAAKFCDILHEAAKDTDIVNTIKFSESKSEGWNTDATGFLNLLNKHSLNPSKALVIGNGASSKSVIWALKKYGVKNIQQIARKFTLEDEKNNSDEKKIRKLSWNQKNFTNSIKESDIIINTTPLGWREEDDIPGFSNSLNSSKVFVDLNYSDKSKLLSAARNSCKLALDGRELLYEQGIEAFKILTNYAPPAEVILNRIFD